SCFHAAFQTFSLSHAHATCCCSPCNNIMEQCLFKKNGAISPECTDGNFAHVTCQTATLHFETRICSMVSCNVHLNLTPPTTAFWTATPLANKVTENMISLTCNPVLWMHIIHITIIHSIHTHSFVSI